MRKQWKKEKSFACDIMMYMSAYKSKLIGEEIKWREQEKGRLSQKEV